MITIAFTILWMAEGGTIEYCPRLNQQESGEDRP